MAIYFSGSRRGFFHEADPGAIPPDAVEISEDRHAQLLAAQAEGKQIGADAQGQPVLVDWMPSEEDLVRSRQEQAQTALNQTNEIVLEKLEAGEPVPETWLDYRTALRAVLRGESLTLPTPPSDLNV